MTDICENEDGAKVAPNIRANRSHPRASLGPVSDEQEEVRAKPGA